MIAAIEARRLHHRQPLDLPVPPETPQMSNIMHQRRTGDGQKCLCVILLALLEGLGIGVHKTRNCVHPVQQDNSIFYEFVTKLAQAITTR